MDELGTYLQGYTIPQLQGPHLHGIFENQVSCVL